MNFNYHTHTFRCHHALGEDREFIEKAIEGGLKKLGFSDHIPFAFPDGHEDGYRMYLADCEEYISTMRRYKEEYRGEIDIKIGFEAEYYPKYFDKMLKYAIGVGAEYMILGQHNLVSDYMYSEYCALPSPSVEFFDDYVDCVLGGMKSGAFTYVAHPDLFNFTGDSEIFTENSYKICRCAKELSMPLEINLVGIRMERHYPNVKFWKIAGDVGCSAVIGFDAHCPKDNYDVKSIEIAKRLANECGVELLEDFDVVDISKLKIQ